ncbi:MAG: hypothetical protein WCE30_24095, partial [Mycobacterium sp.]
LNSGTPQSNVFKKYPVVVLKPIYIPAINDSTSCVNEDTTKRVIAWITGIALEVKARQPYDVWAAGVVRHNVNGETYDSLMVFAAFENINYADLVDLAAVFKRYEPDNLILDDGRYPALDAFVPTPKMVSEVFNYATKIKAAKAENPDLKSWRSDDQTPGRARHAASDLPQQSAPSAASAVAVASDGDIESYF